MTTTVSSHAKTILIGEHSVVYHMPAIAVPLQTLTLKLVYAPKEHIKSWDESWEVKEPRKPLARPPWEICQQLTKALYKACEILHVNISHIPFGNLCLVTKIPLGGGLGGSAAVSVCCLKLIAKLSKIRLKPNQVGLLANEIDCLFHSGRASGLDTQAVSNKTFIFFQKETPLEYIQFKKPFWIFLIDSGERSKTSDMIQKVSACLKHDPLLTNFHFKSLGVLARQCKTCLEQGHYKKLGQFLSQAHVHLAALKVSTPKLDQIVQTVKKYKALGAKLTGAGGGGLVLALFDKKPPLKLKKEFKEFKTYEVHLKP